MNKVYKAAKLDFTLLRYYYKSICFTLLVPLAFVLLYRTLLVGISFAMFMTAMSSIYTFSVADKNDMQRLYGILPVSVPELVLGKYLHILLMGVLALLVSGILQPLLLSALHISVTGSEVLKAAASGMVLFLTYICFQIPGYYKFGPIKGRVFMYVPVAGILLTIFIAEKADINTTPFFMLLNTYTFLGPCLLILYLILIVSISIRVSIHIAKHRD